MTLAIKSHAGENAAILEVFWAVFGLKWRLRGSINAIEGSLKKVR